MFTIESVFINRMVRFLFWLQHILCIVWFLLLFLFWIFYTYESVFKILIIHFLSDFCFFFAKIVCVRLCFQKNGSTISCFHFFKYENWLSIFFSCLWRLVFLLLRISLTFIFISVFDLFISGFYSLCHLVVHFFICALHVMMHQLNKGTTRWHRQWKLETNRLNTLINMKVRESTNWRVKM